MLTRDFDYDLPDELIAQEAAERGKSRLMVLSGGATSHHLVSDLPSFLHQNDVLVVNNTRVIPARLFARRQPAGGRVELLLVDKLAQTEWTVLLKPARRARPGTRLAIVDGPAAEVVEKGADGRHLVRFAEPVEPFLAAAGHVPLPPYIKRPDRSEDRERYQTVYASVDGAIAAPTAGLHFTSKLLSELGQRGVTVGQVTLHVGIGTFKPVTVALAHEHQMESERFDLPDATAEAIGDAHAAGGRVVAVGTTVVRTLEAVAKRHDGVMQGCRGSTDLFIRPGFQFRSVDALLTNFHLPRSTLLMLVCAFAGRERVLDAYREAIRERYRFYSYGDAMLLLP